MQNRLHCVYINNLTALYYLSTKTYPINTDIINLNKFKFRINDFIVGYDFGAVELLYQLNYCQRYSYDLLYTERYERYQMLHYSEHLISHYNFSCFCG